MTATPTMRYWDGTTWQAAPIRLWDGSVWRDTHPPDAPPTDPTPPEPARRPSVWGADITAHLADPSTALATVTVGPGDDVSAALTAAADQAIAAGATAPHLSRVRVIMRPGVYDQRFTLAGVSTNATRRQRVGVELVGQTGDPADVIVNPSDLSKSAFEHQGITALISGITLDRMGATSTTGWAMHGSGWASEAHELILHRVHLRASGADAFSHEMAARHTLYVCDSTVEGNIYAHTWAPVDKPEQGGAPTLAMWDDVDGQPSRVADESAHPDDLLLIRSGVATRPTFEVWHQRTGTPTSPRLRVQIDPATGVTTTKGALVQITDPDVAAHPILGDNPVMRAYWGVSA